MRLYRLFQPVDTGTPGDRYGGIFPQYIGRWNAALSENIVSSLTFDETWRTYKIAPFMSRPFGELPFRKQIGFTTSGGPAICTVRDPREAAPGVLDGWVEAFGLRHAQIVEACGYEPICYTGPPDYRTATDDVTMDTLIREPLLAGWTRIGLDAAAACSRAAGRFETVQALIDRLRTRRCRVNVEGVPNTDPNLAGWIDGTYDLVVDYPFLTTFNPGLVKAGGKEIMIAINGGQAGSPAGRFSESMRIANLGYSVVVEMNNWTPTQLRTARARFGP